MCVNVGIGAASARPGDLDDITHDADMPNHSGVTGQFGNIHVPAFISKMVVVVAL